MINNRKPVHLERIGGKSPRQRIWEVIRKNRNNFNLRKLERETSLPEDTIKTYLKSLLAGGFIESGYTEALPRFGRCSLIKDIGIDAPRLKRDGSPVTDGLCRQAAWQTMRMLKRSFTPEDVAELASTSFMSVTVANVKDYLKQLRKAGYLTVTLGAQKKNIYLLNPSHDTGPRAPMVQRTKRVYDPNLDKVMWVEEPEND